MKPSLQLKLSQHLALTPQLQQSIRLLQLSTLELNQELEQILSDNPLLERLDDPLGGALRLDASGSLASQGQESTAASGSADSTDRSGDSEGSPAHEERAERNDDSPFEHAGDGGDDGERMNDWSSDSGSRAGSDDENDEKSVPQLAATGRTLRDHLMGQLAATQCSHEDRALVGLLIDNLTDDGYLDASMEEIAAMLPEELEIDPQQLSTALKLLQSFDPTGVGARDISESLMLQLAYVQATDPGRAPAAAFELARGVVDGNLGLLATKDFTKLKRLLHCEDDALRDAQTLIRSLNPRPGAAFAIDEPTYVVPDVVVKRTRSGWQAQLNPDVLPKLRINDMYAQILRRSRGSGGNLTAQLQEARWLIKNVQQRFDTILRVAQAIVERQRAFFSHGEVGMRPLVLREIAEELGLHESTVSRVTTQKYMLTPSGTFELKYFFGSHVATDAGGEASSTAIRALIRQLVANEDPRLPLSDSRIAEMLGGQGIVVARRTVAKYREALQIAPVAQRKVL